MTISMEPIAFVTNSRKDPIDDHWGEIVSEVELAEGVPEESLDGIDSFSHVEIIYHFHRSEKTVIGSEHPRENPAWPRVGNSPNGKRTGRTTWAPPSPTS